MVISGVAEIKNRESPRSAASTILNSSRRWLSYLIRTLNSTLYRYPTLSTISARLKRQSLERRFTHAPAVSCGGNLELACVSLPRLGTYDHIWYSKRALRSHAAVIVTNACHGSVVNSTHVE